ncbi:MAG TPA: FliI/YscN family ATPase [Planctomycetes bacterium]|nr:FliI/YscN family ATPase [Planctomycetota bacterium]
MQSEAGIKSILETLPPGRVSGRVSAIGALDAEVKGLKMPVGARCVVRSAGGRREAEVVALRGRAAVITLYGQSGASPTAGLAIGDEVEWVSSRQDVPVGWGMLGRVVDAFGQPLDGKGPVAVLDRAPLYRRAPSALARQRITRRFVTGIRAVDGMLTVGCGQRMGIFSGTGTGKSILLGMIARHTTAPVRVVALVGERGREVREFIERDLGEEGLSRTVVVVSTGEEPPLRRIRAAFTAMSIAEYFRDNGLDVVFLMDSLTRIALAQREIGLASGEPPTTRGYTPSVFNLLPRLLERAGSAEHGTITAFFAVLVEQDDMSEPVSDAARSILDGHVVLSRRLANRGVYPAVDVMESISRSMPDVAAPEHLKAAALFKRLWGAYSEIEDLVNIGAYVRGARAEADTAVEMMPRMIRFIEQKVEEGAGFEETLKGLYGLRDAAAGGGPSADGKEVRRT